MRYIFNRLLKGAERVVPFLAIFLFLLASSAQAQITGMRAGSGAARIRIVLDMDSPAKFKESSTQDRITLEIDTAVKNRLQQTFNDASVKDVSVEKTGKKTSRLQINLKKPAQHKVIVLKNPNRLVIDVYRIQIVKITKDLGNGLSYTYWQDDMSGLPVRLYVLSLAPGSNYELRPFSGAGNANGRGKLTRAVSLSGARAAVNACYFDTDGWVIGNCKWNGSFFGTDGTPRSAFVVDKEGKASVQKDLAYRGTISLAGGRVLTIKGLNRQRITNDLVLFNRNYGAGTRTNEHGREIRIRQGRAAEISNKGNMMLDYNSLVLSGHGVNADALAHVRRGDRIAVDQTLGSRLADEARLVVGAGPLLLENGQVNVRVREEAIAPDIAFRGRCHRRRDGPADGRGRPQPEFSRHDIKRVCAVSEALRSGVRRQF